MAAEHDERRADRHRGDESEPEPRVGAGQPEQRHAWLIRRVSEQPLVGRQRRDGGPGQVRRTGVEQAPPGVLHDDDLLLGLVACGENRQRYQRGGDPGGGGHQTPADRPPHGELDEHGERGCRVPPNGDRPPRTVRGERGGRGGEEREERGQRVKPEIDGEPAGGAVEPSDHADSLSAAAVAAACAIGMLAAILLVPSTRFGYLLYPAAYAVWIPALRGSARAADRQGVEQ